MPYNNYFWGKIQQHTSENGRKTRDGVKQGGEKFLTNKRGKK